MRRFILMLVAVLITLQSYGIIPDRKYIRLPQERGLVYKNLPVETKDGYKIETWFFPAQDMPDYKAGHGGNQSPMVVDFERWMNETLDFMEGKM